MHSVLFVALEPANPSEAWLIFVNGAAKDEKLKKYAERLARNVFLVNFRSCPAALAFLVASAEHGNIPYKILQLAEEPQWLPAADPPTNSAK